MKILLMLLGGLFILISVNVVFLAVEGHIRTSCSNSST